MFTYAKYLIYVIVFLSGIIAGGAGYSKFLVKPIKFPVYKCPDCNCPKYEQKPMIDVDKFKNIRGGVNIILQNAQLQSGDTAIYKKLIQKSVDGLIKDIPQETIIKKHHRRF